MTSSHNINSTCNIKIIVVSNLVKRGRECLGEFSEEDLIGVGRVDVSMEKRGRGDGGIGGRLGSTAQAKLGGRVSITFHQ